MVKRVLVCDDETDVREVLDEALTSEGYSVRTARDGIECLEAIRAEAPDALLLDLRMPRMDGASVLKEMARDPALANIPTIIFSATPPTPEGIKALGAREFLRKPVDLDKLFESVARVVGS